ncbi:MAG: TIGR03435 family protein [Terriglobales bacterium]
MRPHFTVALALACGLALLLAAQQAAAPATFAFDVVSVKPASPDERGGGIQPDPGYQTYICRNAPLEAIMTVAYSVTARQIEGGPSWIRTDRWDVTAKADHPGTVDQLHAALAQVLEDRFHLKVEHLTRQESVFNLEVAPGGPKLTPHNPPNDTHNDPFTFRPAPGQPGEAEFADNNMSMDYLAFSLERIFREGVINQTGLKGTYDIKVDFPFQPPRRRVNGAESGVPAPPDFSPLMAALPRQLGLRLVSGKGPVPDLSILSVAKPSAN